jgi:hypothetical protein
VGDRGEEAVVGRLRGRDLAGKHRDVAEQSPADGEAWIKRQGPVEERGRRAGLAEGEEDAGQFELRRPGCGLAGGQRFEHSAR